MRYDASCPRCGHGLTPIIGHPDCAPWLCEACRRGWWRAELTARDHWRSRPGCFAFPQSLDVGRAVEAERVAANYLGTSLLADHLPHLTAERAAAEAERLQIAVDRHDNPPDELMALAEAVVNLAQEAPSA